MLGLYPPQVSTNMERQKGYLCFVNRENAVVKLYNILILFP